MAFVNNGDVHSAYDEVSWQNLTNVQPAMSADDVYNQLNTMSENNSA